MFYSGGAKKKHAIREILKFKPEKLEDTISESDDSDTSKRSDDRTSRSRRSSRHTSDNEDTDDDHYSVSSRKRRSGDVTTDSDTEDEEESNPDKNDYAVTVGSNDTTHLHYRYSFIDEELDYDIEEYTDVHPELKKFSLVIYKINTRSSTPFLEFLFYYDKSEQESCHLPEYRHKPKHNVRKETDRIMSKLFTGKYRYKGFFHDEQSDQCFVFYEKYFVNEAKNEITARVSLQDSSHWLWVCTTEIIYNKKFMTIPIHENSVDFFVAYPMVGILQATHVTSDDNVSKRFQSIHIEAPSVLYYGSDICYAKNTAVYGLKREPIIARYGPFYYFTTLTHSFYWACYLKSNDKTKKRETSNGAISRYAVFTKRMKTAFIDDDYNRELVKKYTDRMNIFETKKNIYRQTQEEHRRNKTFDSIYGYDYDWTVDYDTIYNGYYEKSAKDILRPVWCVCDHHNFQLLSYSEVNLEKCPEHYDPDFLDYKIM